MFDYEEALKVVTDYGPYVATGLGWLILVVGIVKKVFGKREVTAEQSLYDYLLTTLNDAKNFANRSVNNTLANNTVESIHAPTVRVCWGESSYSNCVTYNGENLSDVFSARQIKKLCKKAKKVHAAIEARLKKEREAAEALAKSNKTQRLVKSTAHPFLCTVKEGFLVKGQSSHEVYVVMNGHRVHVPDWETFDHYKYNRNGINTVSEEQLALIPLGAPMKTVKKA